MKETKSVYDEHTFRRKKKTKKKRKIIMDHNGFKYPFVTTYNEPKTFFDSGALMNSELGRQTFHTWCYVGEPNRANQC